MHFRIRDVLLNIHYALGYFAAGFLGLLLSLPPSFASPIWPAAGVALVGVLLHGAKIFPGIFLGVLLIQTYSYLDSSSTDSFLLSLRIGAGIATGSILQAFLGAALIRRYIGVHDPLIEDKKIFLFLLLGGPLSCIVSATIGALLLLWNKVVQFENIWMSWSIWWVGDTIGVIIFAPLLLLFLGKPEGFWKPRRTYVSYPLVLLLAMIGAIYNYSLKLGEERIAAEFQRQVMSVHTSLQEEINNQIGVNQTLKALFDSAGEVDHEMFHRFCLPLIDRLGRVVALEWIPRIEDADRAGLEQRERLTIREIAEDGRMVAARQRQHYFPIYYAEPHRNNESLRGLDVASEPGLLPLIRRVVDSGRTLSSEGIVMMRNQNEEMGVVLYSPVYRQNHSLLGFEQKRRAFVGLVASVFNIEGVVSAAMQHNSGVELLLAIEDDGRPLYRYAGYEADRLHRYGHEKTLPVEVAGRVWQVTFRSSPSFYANQQSWTTWWLLLIGLVLASLLTMGLMLLTGRAARVEELVRIKTRDLEAVNMNLNREMRKRHKLQVEQISRNRVLEQLAQGDTLEKILRRIALEAQKQKPGLLCSILLLDADKQRLYNGASPSLPDHFCRELNGVPVGDGLGACGTAAYRKEIVIVENILTHPFCRPYRKQFLKTELRACWSVPIVTSRNTVLGTFASYYTYPRFPELEDVRFVKRLAQLCAIAIERKNNESELRIAATTFQSDEAIMVTDSEGVILRVNLAFSKITGYRESEAIGQNPEILACDQNPPGYYRQIFKALLKNGRWEGEIWNRRKNGEIFPEWLIVTTVRNDRHEVSHYVAIFSDITEKKAAEKEIRDLAYYDPLTGLPNRRLLLDRLKHEIITAKRHRRFGALFFLDLDHFKRLNDSLGHQVGDELLIQVARRINTLLREEDTACRLGGDEFIVLVAGQGESIQQATDHAALLGEKIRDVINQPFILQGNSHHFTTSIGISVFPDLTEQPEAIIQQADTAMYRAKEHGRNSICFFRPSMQKLADKRLLLEKEMREALRDEHFVLFYQPQVDRNGRVVSVEALIRWYNPGKGMISPADFIPVAEETQLILPIGLWVLRESCRQIRKWDDENREIGHVAVNVSSRQFRQTDFVDQVKDALNEAGIEASRLMIELTEGVVIDHIEDTVEKMQALKAMGVGISIDDFGTGYSSLSYLKQLPISQLKIDQNFVRDVASDPNDAVIVETIINMAMNLGLNVIAEGVENQEQMNFLRARGCVHFQGYFFGRPVTAASLSIGIERNEGVNQV